MKQQHSIIRRALQIAFIRIGLVATLAGVISYQVNSFQIKKAVREQLTLSTQERLQRESLLFKEIKQIHHNYLNEFKSIYAHPERRKELLNDFDKYFYIRAKDNSYQERPEIFNGSVCVNGKDLSGTSASFPPNEPINDDIKIRFALTFILNHNYGVMTKNHFFNFYASIPESGWTSHWEGHHDSDVDNYNDPNYVKLKDLEWFQLSYNSNGPGTSFTNMYFDPTMKLWMISLLSYNEPIAGQKQLYSVGTDFVLDQLISRTAKPSIHGSKAVIFRNDEQGTLIYHPSKINEIKKSGGKISITSTNDLELLPILNALKSSSEAGESNIIETDNSLFAFGIIPETDWCMTVEYPKVLMRPAILQNLGIVAAVGLLTLLIEIFLLRSILQKQVAGPLTQLLNATRQLGTSNSHLDIKTLPTKNTDEIGRLARDFATMAERVQNTRDSLEETVVTRTKELEAAKNAANAANHAKTMFLANMSHEIRTPMHGILGMANGLRRLGVTPQQAEKLDNLDKAADHLLSIINAILDLSKIESGKLLLEVATVNINDTLSNVYAILSESAKTKGLSLVIESNAWEYNLYGDATRIQQALLNYTINAIKFTEKGTVTISAIKQSETERFVLVRFEVKDTGVGISPEALPRLFNSFEQADNSTTRKYGGTGLGLVITRLLAELMGGEAGVKSTVGEGSTFWFTANLRKKENQIEPVQNTKKENAESIIKQFYQGKRILVVDDEPLNREMIKSILEDAKLNATVAVNGLEAIDKIKHANFDIIIMDMQMPKLGGLDATHQIRQLPGYNKTPIIAMTANAFTEDKQRCIDAGMNDILVKPFDSDDIFEMILKWLSTS